jgi:hypothetical protein
LRPHRAVADETMLKDSFLKKVFHS